MTWTHYEEVSIKGYKKGKCLCGKHRTRTMKFWQTISPFNKNPDGTYKDSFEIRKELELEREAWMAEPITCDNCIV